MVWFKVDDQMTFHHKVVAAGNAAMGLWVRAGAWSMAHGTDGFIPDPMVALLGSPAQRKRLLKAGLWHEVDARGSRPAGCQFHQFNEEGRQPTTEQVKKKKKNDAERKARESRRRNGFPDDFSEEPQVDDPTHGVSPHGVTAGVLAESDRDSSPPDPARPVLADASPTARVAGSPAAALRSAPVALEGPLPEIPRGDLPTPAGSPTTDRERAPRGVEVSEEIEKRPRRTAQRSPAARKHVNAECDLCDGSGRLLDPTGGADGPAGIGRTIVVPVQHCTGEEPATRPLRVVNHA